MTIKSKIFDTDHLTNINTPLKLGVEGIEVKIVSCISNPYRSMVDMALATWGSDIESWSKLTPEERFSIVDRVMHRKALPLGRESPSFLFSIYGVTRSSFDQIARQRIGSTFSSLGWNNVHTQTGFRIPNEILQNELGQMYEERIEATINKVKELYSDMIKDGISWQSAREVLPLGMLHWFHFNITFEALLSFCSRRLCFGEKEDTVAVAWLMRERVKEKFPYLASYLRPACDWSMKCNYHTDNSLAEEMGTLFESCERNRCEVEEPNVDFHRPSTRRLDLEKDLKMKIPCVMEERPLTEYESLDELDKKLFNEY